jgi:hypothetical protein
MAHLLDVSRVSHEKIDNLIRGEEWNLLIEDEEMKMKHGEAWLSNLNQQLNDDHTNSTEEVITNRLKNRERILSNIKALINFSTLGFRNTQQSSLLRWSQISYKFCQSSIIDNTRKVHQCIFTHEKPEKIVKLQLRCLNLETAQVEDSPIFYCSEGYDVLVRCWNVLSRLEAEIHSTVQQKLEALSEENKEYAVKQLSLLLHTINCAARYLFVFVLYQRNSIPICKHSIISFKTLV